MPAQPVPLNDVSRTSSLRFGLRTLLYLTLAAAVMAFVAAPFLRTLSSEQWWRLAKTLGLSVFGAGILISAIAWLRYRVDRCCGKPLLSIANMEIPSLKLVSIVMLLVSFALILMFSVLAVRIPPKSNDWMMRYTNPLMWGIMFAIHFATLTGVKRHSMTICENGIAWAGIRFAPWSAVHVRHWDQAAGELTLTLNRNVVTLCVSREAWPKIRDVLLEHVEI